MLSTMHTLKAEVRNGRITIDGFDRYPDGTVLELKVLNDIEHDEDAHLDAEDEMGEEERERLHAALDKAIEEAHAGLGRPVDEFFAQLKSR